MKYAYLALTALASTALYSCQSSSTEKKSSTQSSKPNIVVLLVDDAGYADFGFMGCKDLETPNIDKLAKGGVVFTDAHTAASVSGPSRAGLMTGRYQQRFGYECNPGKDTSGVICGETLLAQYLHDGGYTTAALGKWHLGSKPEYLPNKRGFDYWYGFPAGSRPYFCSKVDSIPGHPQAMYENGIQTPFKGYLTDRLANHAKRFIIENKEKPFFLYFAPNAVHTPLQATIGDLERYKDHPRQKLAAMTWALDRAVGEIVTTLEESHLMENTLIFFLSDNGGATNNQSSCYPLKGFKGNDFEGGHRVPFIVAWKGKIHSGKFDKLTSSLDIFATAIDVAGAKPNASHPLDGVSLIPFLAQGKDGAPHDTLFWRKDNMAAVRTDSMKLIRVRDLGEKLYNVKNDLGETHDLLKQDQVHDINLNRSLTEWENGLDTPHWLEGPYWNDVSWQINHALFCNEEVRLNKIYRLASAHRKEKHG